MFFSFFLVCAVFSVDHTLSCLVCFLLCCVPSKEDISSLLLLQLVRKVCDFNVLTRLHQHKLPQTVFFFFSQHFDGVFMTFLFFL